MKKNQQIIGPKNSLISLHHLQLLTGFMKFLRRKGARERKEGGSVERREAGEMWESVERSHLIFIWK